jgi:uncharacterized protein (DUF488 family)
MATIYTIGFSGKGQDAFMGILDTVGIRTLVDVRLWRQSRFVPWASGANLAEALGERYSHVPGLAPTKELLSGYKDGKIDWTEYESTFKVWLAIRRIEILFTPNNLDKLCFLCSEKTADKCHRRLVAEYLAARFPDIRIIHL